MKKTENPKLSSVVNPACIVPENVMKTKIDPGRYCLLMEPTYDSRIRFTQVLTTEDENILLNKKKGKAISNQCDEPRRTSNCVLDFTLILDRRALLVAIIHSSSRPRSQRRKAKMRMEPFHSLLCAGKAWGSSCRSTVDTSTVWLFF